MALKYFLYWGFLMVTVKSIASFYSFVDLKDKASNELAADLAGLNPIASLINQIDMPEDDTPKGPEDEDDVGSGKEKKESTDKEKPDPKGKKSCEEEKAKNETTEQASLIHMTFDDMCSQAVQHKIKILPVYIVGWGLKECGDINDIPFKRFQMDQYLTRKPKFDIAGMCIPLKGREFTLLMVDPDAPSKESHRCRSWLHWLVVNIPKGNVSSGHEIVAYNPPSPPNRSGPHRYFFILYEQKHHINKVDDSTNNLAVRCGFSVKHFAEDNSLAGPVAINMFKTEKKRSL